jgi:hypothetical protein
MGELRCVSDELGAKSGLIPVALCDRSDSQFWVFLRSVLMWMEKLGDTEQATAQDRSAVQGGVPTSQLVDGELRLFH